MQHPPILTWYPNTGEYSESGDAEVPHVPSEELLGVAEPVDWDAEVGDGTEGGQAIRAQNCT